MTVVLLFSLVWFIFPLTTPAQEQTGILMGFIYEKDGKTPLEDARVILKKVKGEPNGRIFRSAYTGETGDYKMQNIPAGKYKAAIELKNSKMYQTLVVVEVIANKTVIRSFYLVPKRPFLAFFYEPCGLAMTIAGTALIIKIIEEEESPTEL